MISQFSFALNRVNANTVVSTDVNANPKMIFENKSFLSFLLSDSIEEYSSVVLCMPFLRYKQKKDKYI